MKGVIKVENPDDVDVTMTVTMKLGEWSRLADQLGTNWPSWKLGSMITSLVMKCTKHFHEESEFRP